MKTKTQCPTPRTDAAIETVDVAFVGFDGLSSAPEEYVEPDFARQLETELRVAQEAVTETTDNLLRLSRERDQLRHDWQHEHTRKVDLEHDLDAALAVLKLYPTGEHSGICVGESHCKECQRRSKTRDVLAALAKTPPPTAKRKRDL